MHMRSIIIMDLINGQYLITILFASVSLILILFVHKLKTSKKTKTINLPPGTTGWPIIGETFEFFMRGRSGRPEKFIFDRMAKHSQDVFRTSVVGENFAVICGALGNKFLFTGGNKYVTTWWPRSTQKVLFFSGAPSCINLLFEFLKPEALQHYIPVMDSITQDHLESHWLHRKEVKVLQLAKKFAFSLSCRLFMSVQDPNELERRLYKPFTHIVGGSFSMPINFPCTNFNRAIKGSKFIRDELVEIIKQRRKELLENKKKNKQLACKDLLTRMLITKDEDGKNMSEKKIAELIVGLLFASHDTTSRTITLAINYLAENPCIYENVLKEQMEIAKSKSKGESLNWKDIQRMKYSWCVVCETLRISPIGPGPFREVLIDFTYAGFTIPKGWKIFSPTHSTHKNPKYFPNPDKFDPSRFQGDGPAPYVFVPFGGGTRMCPGKEYARLEILVFMHYLVTKFRWEKIYPDEKVICNPFPKPKDDLLIHLFTYESSQEHHGT